ncbi:L,D-transpeptidase [Pontibacillus salicampi]|uniref:L,D-transpeptidase n=1 Tax=Pontibacillus salicampi TaxID=1449801 RepID=A0ABV6LSM8_9BACI
MEHSQQKLVVTAFDRHSRRAHVVAYEKAGNVWVQALPVMEAVIGKNGVGKLQEGDDKTPLGTYPLGTAFGWGEQPLRMSYPYRIITNQDYWVDDPDSDEYNQWVHVEGDPSEQWKSYEVMNHPLYKYGAVIEYNTNPVVKGKGSAIFIHMKQPDTAFTAGCVALKEADVVRILQWLEEDKHPVIHIRTSE